MPGCGVVMFGLADWASARGWAIRLSVPITAIASRNDCFIRFTSLERSMRCEALDQRVIQAVERALMESDAKLRRPASRAPLYRQRLPGRSRRPETPGSDP